MASEIVDLVVASVSMLTGNSAIGCEADIPTKNAAGGNVNLSTWSAIFVNVFSGSPVGAIIANFAPNVITATAGKLHIELSGGNLAMLFNIGSYPLSVYGVNDAATPSPQLIARGVLNVVAG